MITILFIDDEPAIRELVKNFLELSGELKVDEAPSAEVAIGMMKEKTYDAIVCDYLLPGGMNGIKFLTLIRNAGNRIPFLIFTGRGQEEVAIEAINNGADFYIQKDKASRGQFVDLMQKIGQAVQRRRMEAALQESERNYRDLVANLPDVILTTDKSGTITRLNSTGDHLLGATADTCLNQPWTRVLDPDDRKPAQDAFMAMMATQVPFSDLEARLGTVAPDGEKTVVAVRGAVLYNTDGSVRGARIILRDQTPQKELKEQLRTTAEKLQTLLDIIPRAIITLDRQGTVVLWSRGAVTLFGWSEEDAVGKFLPAIPMQKTAEFRKLLVQSLEGDGVRKVPFTFRDRNGIMENILLDAAPLHDRAGNVTGILMVARRANV